MGDELKTLPPVRDKYCSMAVKAKQARAFSLLLKTLSMPQDAPARKNMV
jgi:hypothetical protein